MILKTSNLPFSFSFLCIHSVFDFSSSLFPLGDHPYDNLEYLHA